MRRYAADRFCVRSTRDAVVEAHNRSFFLDENRCISDIDLLILSSLLLYLVLDDILNLSQSLISRHLSHLEHFELLI